MQSLQSLIGHFDLDPNRVFDIVSCSYLLLSYSSRCCTDAEIDNQRLIFGLQLFHDFQVLECFELQPDSNVFLELIPIFPKV
jgi:THO complex subunit 2